MKEAPSFIVVFVDIEEKKITRYNQTLAFLYLIIDLTSCQRKLILIRLGELSKQQNHQISKFKL